MEITINQIQNLEKYIKISGDSVDKILANSISKLYKRELKKIEELILKLQGQIKSFEKENNMDSSEFIKKYEAGSLGDDIDFVEWAATVEMLNNANRKLAILQDK